MNGFMALGIGRYFMADTDRRVENFMQRHRERAERTLQTIGRAQRYNELAADLGRFVLLAVTARRLLQTKHAMDAADLDAAAGKVALAADQAPREQVPPLQTSPPRDQDEGSTMSWIEALIDNYLPGSEQRKIDEAIERYREVRFAARPVEKDPLIELEDDLGRGLLLMHTLIEASIAKGIFTREEFNQTARQLDLLDGTADGKLDPSVTRRRKE